MLIVEDEPQLLRALRINLKARGYETATAADGVRAMATAAREIPDVVILDLGLPDVDGLEIIRSLRTWTRVPIIVLSGRADATVKVAALDLGADDYLTKPFSMEELLAASGSPTAAGLRSRAAPPPCGASGAIPSTCRPARYMLTTARLCI